MSPDDHGAADDAFERFVETLQGHVGAAFGVWSGHEALIQACGGDARLALAVFYVAGERSLKWMDERAPVLGGTTPRRCLVTSKGRERLRRALLSCP